MAEARIPFIPLCFEILENYVIVGGVGGKLVILNAETGAMLFDMYNVSDMDPYLI